MIILGLCLFIFVFTTTISFRYMSGEPIIRRRTRQIRSRRRR